MLNKKELKQFGNFVHSKRMELGRAALPFLRDLGITLSYFHNLLEIENGEREPTLIFVNKLIAEPSTTEVLPLSKICETSPCFNDGVCTEHGCICPSGYTGSFC